MRDKLNEYKDGFIASLELIEVTEQSKRIVFDEGIKKAANLIAQQYCNGHKVMFIGNGASAAISSHMAADFCKNGKIRALSFNDAALLTASSNDLGYKYVFSKPIEIFGDCDDTLIAISSSGMSKNIINGVRIAKSMHCKIITLSGQNSNNTLRMLGDINFYVPTEKYGYIEVIHHFICHFILDLILANY